MPDKDPLNSLFLSYPCPISWDTMDGNERERLCRQCDKKVFNISDMTESEANAFLSERNGNDLCVKFFMRSDGTIKTDNCPRYLRPARNTFRYLQYALTSIGAFVMSSFHLSAIAAEKGLFHIKFESHWTEYLPMTGARATDEVRCALYQVYNARAKGISLNAIEDLKRQVEKTKTVKRDDLQNLLELYLKHNQSEDARDVLNLEILLIEKERNPDFDRNQAILHVINTRSRIAEKYYESAKDNIKKGNQSQAVKDLEQFFFISELNSKFEKSFAETSKLPTIRTFVDHPFREHLIVCSDERSQAICSLLKSVTNPSQVTRLFLKRVQMAQEMNKALKAGNTKTFMDLKQRCLSLSQISAAVSDSTSILIAEFLGPWCGVKSIQESPVGSFRIINQVSGKGIPKGKVIHVDLDHEIEYIESSGIFFPEEYLPGEPKIGSMWILLLNPENQESLKYYETVGGATGRVPCNDSSMEMLNFILNKKQ